MSVDSNTTNPSSAPVQHSQYAPMQSAQALGGLDHELWSNGNPPGINPAGPYPAMNYVNAPPPTGYTGSMGYDPGDPSHQATGPAGLGNQCQRQRDDHRTAGITQRIPFTSGPPRLEQYAPEIPVLPIDHPPSHFPLPRNMAGPSRANPSILHPGMSVAEGLKSLASHYLHSPGSHVDKLRMRQSRSGTVKVLILLEIDDTM